MNSHEDLQQFQLSYLLNDALTLQGISSLWCVIRFTVGMLGKQRDGDIMAH